MKYKQITIDKDNKQIRTTTDLAHKEEVEKIELTMMRESALNQQEHKVFERKNKKYLTWFKFIYIALFLMIAFMVLCLCMLNNINKDISDMNSQLKAINEKTQQLEIELDKHYLEITEVKEVEVTKPIGTSFKSYMDYTAITNKASKQYALQQNATTDENGLRRLDGYYLIATGSAYGNVGDILEITLSNGNTFYAVKGDAKADKDTDGTNTYCIHDGSVIEFIVETSKLDSEAKKLGNISAIEYFNGEIESIRAIAKYNGISE